jgi:hypothetical protein
LLKAELEEINWMRAVHAPPLEKGTKEVAFVELEVTEGKQFRVSAEYDGATLLTIKRVKDSPVFKSPFKYCNVCTLQVEKELLAVLMKRKPQKRRII